VRNFQRNYPNLEKFQHTDEINGVHCTALRLDWVRENQLFGNQFITIIYGEDPLKWKFLRAAHEEKNSIMSLRKEMHYPLKAVRARVKTGAIALVWKGQNMDFKKYSEGCLLCQSL
jgi:hypothetical protein